MRIAVSAQGQERASQVDARFGRAMWLVFYDTESDELEAIDNAEQRDMAQGAGIQAARRVIDSQADVLLTGHCGPKAFQMLAAAGVKVFVGLGGTVNDALDRYARGELTPSDQSDVEGHW